MSLKSEENKILNVETTNEKFNIEILKNDLKALKTELSNTQQAICQLKHSVLKQQKNNENLKKLIIKQVKKFSIFIKIF